jgi:hypothetical protein
VTPLFAVSTGVATSVIAAAASLTGALITAILGQRIKKRNDERLEKLKDELIEARSEREAQRDYRYDAVKRLYTDLQPLLFQLSELCDSAYMHARGLARTGRNGKLGKGPDSWVGEGYYLISTAYRLLVPVSLMQLMQRRLTLVDLSVDDALKEQYRFARALAGAWIAGFDVAAKEPPLEYRPHDRDAPDRLQHLYAGQLETAAGCLLVRDPDNGLRPRTYSELEAAYRDGDAREAFAPAVALFEGFHPRTHPVLWRTIVVQVHLHRAIARTFAEEMGVVVPPDRALPDEERHRFDWREPGAPETDQQAVDAPFGAALAYLDDVLGRSE